MDALVFTKHARDLGCSLDHITSTQRLQALNHIAQLDQLATELERIVGFCNRGNRETCRVLTALGEHN
ncbi:MAG: hypothetical protein ACU0AZ_00920 [Paracoccaceae bacterium]